MQKNKLNLYISIGSLLAFLVWTLLVRTVDLKLIGPNGSVVGFATVNGFFHKITGVNMTLYTVTDWLGLVPVFIGFGFAIFGLCQWIRRRGILKVDYSILVLGVFYIVVALFYILFEYVVVNYRPTLINGYLEVSYPSSTILLVLTVMPTGLMQFRARIKSKIFSSAITVLIVVFTSFMVVGRLISGVHWLSDIIGGGLLSIGLVMGYKYAVNNADK